MLRDDIFQLTHGWASRGHKANRARQRRMMLTFADFAEAAGARQIGMLGGRMVIRYWKHLRALGRSYATQMDHWRALRELWALAGIPGEVPAPRCPDASTRQAAL